MSNHVIISTHRDPENYAPTLLLRAAGAAGALPDVPRADAAWDPGLPFLQKHKKYVPGMYVNDSDYFRTHH